jgi:hypothetical protein
MKRYLLILSVIFLFLFVSGLFQSSTSGLFDKTEITGAKILNYGICTATTTKKVKAKDTASGKRKIIKDTEFVETTTKIPAILGNSFCIRYSIEGKPDDRRIKLRVKLIHPIIKNPDEGTTETISAIDIKPKIGSISTTNFTFDTESELIPGNYTFQIYYKDRKLLEKTFSVYLP